MVMFAAVAAVTSPADTHLDDDDDEDDDDDI